MKTAISVPDDVFAKVDELARREGRSRSDVYTAAAREYVARYDVDEVTRSIDRAIEGLGDESGSDDFVRTAASVRLGESRW